LEALSVEELVERHHALEKRFKELADEIGREVHEKALEIMAGGPGSGDIGQLVLEAAEELYSENRETLQEMVRVMAEMAEIEAVLVQGLGVGEAKRLLPGARIDTVAQILGNDSSPREVYEYTLSTLGDENAVKALLGELLYEELKAASLTANREAAVTVTTATPVPVAEPGNATVRDKNR